MAREVMQIGRAKFQWKTREPGRKPAEGGVGEWMVVLKGLALVAGGIALAAVVLG